MTKRTGTRTGTRARSRAKAARTRAQTRARTQAQERLQVACTWLVGGGLALALAALAVWGVWRAMQGVSPNLARAWALIVTALLPLVAWAGWYFGHTEARGRLAGIDQAVDKVMGAATRAAGLRVATSHAMRAAPARPQPQEPYTVVLPEVEIIPRQLPSGGDVIEL